MKKSLNGLMLLCLVLLFLSGCALKPAPVVVVEEKTEYVTIPEEWLEPCPVSELEGIKNRDLWQGFKNRGNDLAKCNARFDTIRNYQRFNMKQD